MPAGDPAGDPIALLLEGRYPDPDVPGALLRAESRSVVIEDSLAGAGDELVRALGVGPHVAVLSDANTHAALGARVERALGGRFAVQSLVLGDAPHADADTVARILAALDPRTDAVIAVGSGTLNDLSKMVAFQRDCPQLVFATAPSMNGYTSLSASITSDGIKRSVRTRTPLGVFFDLRVLAAAPARLIRAGLGDSSCRSTAQADWLLSHLLLDRPYRQAPFALLAADEDALFAQTAGLVRGDLAAMRHLARTLALPFVGASPEHTMQLALHRPPRPLRAIRRDIPGALDHLIRRALAKDPDRRFQDAEEMLLALADVPSDREIAERIADDERDEAASTIAIAKLDIREPSLLSRIWTWLRYGGWRWRHS